MSTSIEEFYKNLNVRDARPNEIMGKVAQLNNYVSSYLPDAFKSEESFDAMILVDRNSSVVSRSDPLFIVPKFNLDQIISSRILSALGLDKAGNGASPGSLQLSEDGVCRVWIKGDEYVLFGGEIAYRETVDACWPRDSGQPEQSQGGGLYLIGFVNSSRLQRESILISQDVMIIFGIFAFMVLLGWPIFEFMYLKTTGGLLFKWTIVLSKFFFAAPLTIGLIYLSSKIVLMHEVDRNLKDTADEMRNKFDNEREELRKQLRGAEERLFQNPFRNDETIDGEDLIFQSWKEGVNYPYFKRATVYANNGATKRLSQTDASTRLQVNISRRPYFLNAKRRQGQTEQDNLPLSSIEPLYSWRTGELGTVVAMPTRESEYPVLTLFLNLLSLEKVILTDGYRFAVMDKDGKSLYHSVRSRRLFENFIEASSFGPELSHFLRVSSDNYPSFRYQGRPVRGYVSPLTQSFPEGGWTLVVYREFGPIQSVLWQAFVYSMLWSMIFWTGLFLSGLAIGLIYAEKANRWLNRFWGWYSGRLWIRVGLYSLSILVPVLLYLFSLHVESRLLSHRAQNEAGVELRQREKEIDDEIRSIKMNESTTALYRRRLLTGGGSRYFPDLALSALFSQMSLSDDPSEWKPARRSLFYKFLRIPTTDFARATHPFLYLINTGETAATKRGEREGKNADGPSLAAPRHEYHDHEIDFLRQLMNGQLYEPTSVLLRNWILMVDMVLIFLFLLLIMIFLEKLCRMSVKDFKSLKTFDADSVRRGQIPPGAGLPKTKLLKTIPWLSVSILLLLALTQKQFYLAITGVIPVLSSLFLFVERIRTQGKPSADGRPGS
jgi:hypothetical protein